MIIIILYNINFFFTIKIKQKKGFFMLKSFKIIRKYYTLANLKWYLVLLEFIFLLIPSILSIISPLLTAKIITCLTVYDFKQAKFFLIVDLLIIIVTALLYFFYHFCTVKTNKLVLYKINNYIYDIVKNNKNINSVSSVILSDVWVFAKFNKNLLYKICFLIKSIVILSIIIFYNFYIGIVIFLVSLLSSFLLKITNKKIQNNSFTFSEKKVETLELFNSIQKGIKLDNNETIEKSMKNKFYYSINNMLEIDNKISFFYNLNNNFISLILKIAVFCLTFYLISLVKSTFLTLSVYLVLTPYLTSSAQNLITFFEVFTEIGIIENIIREFDELKEEFFEINLAEKSIEKIDEKITNYDLEFYHLSIKKQNFFIEDFSLTIPHKSITCFIDKENYLKKYIFDLLIKKEIPTSGSILFNKKNINDLPQNLYTKITSYMSIIENLLLVCDNKNIVIKTLKDFNFLNLINSLPNQLNQIIDENFNKNLLYILGIIRAYLLDPKIICIYEIPNDFSTTYFELFFNLLNKISKSKTVIIFLNKKIEQLKNVKNYYIQENKIEEEK